jgi:hypothetical protein
LKALPSSPGKEARSATSNVDLQIGQTVAVITVLLSNQLSVVSICFGFIVAVDAPSG